MSDATIDFIDAAIALHAGEGNPLTVLRHLQPLIEPSPHLIEVLFTPDQAQAALDALPIEYRQGMFARHVSAMYSWRGWQATRVDGQLVLWSGQPFPATLQNILSRHPAPVEEVRGAAAVFGLVVLPATPDSHWWRVVDPGGVRPPERLVACRAEAVDHALDAIDEPLAITRAGDC